ncbi:MAG: zinc-ribbon domain-containing protein, partial [Burkholderiaceae bacterium]
MIELICLPCGQSNPADAKFCSQCGAALLRRFCEQCHAVNDAEAHFCRSCGAALAQQLLPATLAPMPAAWREDARVRDGPGGAIPTLDYVVATDEAEVAMTAPTLQPLQEPTPALVDEAASGGSALQPMRPAHRTALLSVGGLLVLLVAAALWSRAPRTDQRPRDAGATSTLGAAPADMPTTPPSLPPQPASPTATGGSAPVEGKAPA